MNGLKGIKATLLLLVFTFVLIACSGGGDGIDGTGLKGTAAIGAPISNAPVLVKDANGTKVELSTDDNGKWGIEAQDMGGLTPPFIIKVEISSDQSLFSLATERGFANITPISDVAARNWFKSRGRDIETEHDDDNPIVSPPTKANFDPLKIALKNLFRIAFSEFNLPEGFDFIKSKFDADHTGFDGLLDHLHVTIANDRVIILIRDPEYGFLGRIIFDFDLNDDLSEADATPPSDPANLIAVPASPTEMILVWNTSTDNIGVAGYKIYRDGVEIAESPYPVYIDAGLTEGVEYCYEVEAFDGSDNFSLNRSNEACKNTLNQADTVAPDAPNAVTAIAISDSEINLTWLPSPQDDVLGYHVYRTTTSGNTGEKIATVISSNYADIDLDAGTEYCYTVKAFDAVPNLSDFSSESCDTTFDIVSQPLPQPQVAPVVSLTNLLVAEVSGTAQPGSDITISGGASVANTVADANGVFSVDVQLTANAANVLTVYATDSSNNVSPVTALDTSGNPLSITQDSISPDVASVSPADGDTGASRSTSITITFTENISVGSVVPANIMLKQGANIIASSLAPAGNVVTIVPTSPLESLTEYSVEVLAAGIEDDAGNVMSLDFNSSFTTLNTNTPPEADAGPDQTVPKNSLVNLDGSGSFDVDGDDLTYQWIVLQQPSGSNISLVNPGSVAPSFTPQISGDYIFQLSVNDGLVDNDPDPSLNQVVITAVNSAPVANAGPDQFGILTGATVNLNGSASSDVNGDSLTYQWLMTSRPAGSNASLSNANTETPSFIADVRGNYQIQLIVNDGEVNSNPDFVVVSVANNVPTADAGVDQSVLVGDTVTIDGSGSSDLDTDPLTYSWILLDNPPGSAVSLPVNPGASFNFVPDVAGNYTIQLVVNDGIDDSNADLVVITVAGDVGVPIADAGPDQRVGVGDTVTLDGSGSSDPESDPLTYSWVILDAPPNSAATLTNGNTVAPTFVADKAGDYTIQLVVSDGVNDSAPDTVVITAGLMCGTMISESLDQAAEIDQYTFVGTSGHKVALTIVETGGFGTTPDPRMTLFSPSSVQIGSFYDAHNSPLFTLTENGVHTVRIQANDLVSTGTYNLQLVCITPPSPVVADLAPGDLVTGELTQAGQTELYTFTGNSGDTISLSLVELAGFGSAPDPRMRLYTPSGILVGSYYDAHNSPTFVLTETGTYTVRIMANDFVSTGTFNIGYEVLSPAQAVTANLVPGDLITGELTQAGQTELYTFSGSSGDTITLSLVELSGFGTTPDPRMRLYTPSGILVGNYYDAHNSPTFVLTETGTYTIRIMANDFVSTGTFNLGYEVLSPAQAVTGNLVPGDLVTGELTRAGQTELYTFSGNMGDTITITMVELSGFGSAPDPRMRLYTPSGILVGSYYDAHNSPTFVLTETGAYTIRIMANDFVSTGTFNLGYEVLSPAQAVTGNLVPGDLVTGQLNQAGQTELYTFSGGSGDTITLSLVELSGFGTTPDPRMRLYTPSGILVGNYYDAHNSPTFVLTETGTYTIRIMANDFVSTGTFNIGYEVLSSNQAVTGNLAPGDLVTGELTQAGQTELYTFTGNSGDTISLSLVELAGFGSAPDPRMRLYTPSGILVGSYYDAHNSPTFVLTETGTYTVRIMANDFVSTGTFNIGYEVLSPAQAVTANLVPGDLITGELTQAGQTELYTFSGSSGDTITLSLVELSGFGTTPDPRMRLYTPSGILVGNYYDAHNSPTFVLTETGTYTIRIMANDFVSTGTFNLGYEVLSPAQAVTGTLNFGDILNGGLSTAGETELYTFDATAGQNIQLTLVELGGFGSAPDPRMRLYTPSGTLVGSYYDANSSPTFNNLPETGTYTIRIMANTFVNTGTFSIGLTLLP